MTAPVRIVGSYLSPYVRKVLVVLDLKGIDYRIDPIVPFFGDDRFAKASPLRRVPVYIDEEVTLSDSSVICQYLEDRHPDPSIYPADIADRARARWLEEYADTRMGDVFIWKLFNQVAIGPAVWGKAADQAAVRHTIEEEIPSVLDYVEAQVPADGFLFGAALSIADVSLAVFFRNAAFARYTIDAARWPKSAAFVGRVFATSPFQRLAPFEKTSLGVPIAKQREALTAAGAPLTPDTWAAANPRAGIMPT